jgi:predicted Zn-dependent protease
MGLILLTQTESELAAVLAHEITHVTQHHFTRSMVAQQRSLLYSLAALAVAIAASRSGAVGSSAIPAGIAAAQGLAIQSQLNCTRENEYEADRIRFQRLDAAKFDVTAMATFMERLQSRGASPTATRRPSAYAPVTHERIAEAQSRVRQAVPAGSRLAQFPARARAPQLPGHARGGRRLFHAALADHKSQRRVFGENLVASCSAPRTSAREDRRQRWKKWPHPIR